MEGGHSDTRDRSTRLDRRQSALHKEGGRPASVKFKAFLGYESNDIGLYRLRILFGNEWVG